MSFYTLRLSIIPKLSFILFFSFCLSANGQKEINYYLPDMEYDSSIPTPEEFLGYQIGEWHITHDQLNYYMRALANASDRVQITEYAKSYEERSLIYLTISLPKNLTNQRSIRQQNVALTDPSLSEKIDINKLPMVIYQGYSIHGNEASGGNAAALVAYYLAASQDKEVLDLLEETIILLDPCMNPDGFQRFSSWVNSHKSKHLVSDPSNREFNEAWPKGRTNHYWFDLNRDWLLLTHPESRGRIKTFHHWKPSILTDHHEMGTNSTFFFQPGVPSRTNPNTPQINQDITEEIGTYHAAALDEIGSKYFSKERYDDYYYGKGSTYPDINGCIGILFEQASARGHLQESTNGPLSFPFAIRNQVVTSISTQKAALNMRKEILSFKRNAFLEAQKEAKANHTKAYVFEDPDLEKTDRFIDILQQHQLKVYELNKDLTIEEKLYSAKANNYIVPLEQPQYKLVKTIFEKVNKFPDSIFYDVSTWTMPLAFDLDYSPVTENYDFNLLGKQKLSHSAKAKEKEENSNPSISALLPWDRLNSPKVLTTLLKNNFNIEYISLPIEHKNKRFGAGSLLLKSLDKLSSAQKKTISNIEAMGFNLTDVSDIKDISSTKLKLPKVGMIVGDGINAYEAGDIWFAMDQEFGMNVIHLDIDRISRLNLESYDILILPDGNYNKMNKEFHKKMKDWVETGGQIIAFRKALHFLNRIQIIELNNTEINSESVISDNSNQSGAKVLGGAIFESTMNLEHPLCFGYNDNRYHLFKRGTQFYAQSENLKASPVRYSSTPLVSGYMHQNWESRAKNATAVTCFVKGKGRIIAFVDNPLFRGYWLGGLKLFANSLYFGGNLSREYCQD